jgi:nicotinamide-nucleotide adenylyltransferase
MDNHIALIVGRFQPFHKGHLYLIKKALKIADKITIGIGSANISDENNPLDFETRKKIIKAVAYKEKIEEKIIKIVPLDDFFDDKKWLENVKKQIGDFDVVLGNNDWTNNILEKAGYKVIKVDYLKRGVYEGWRIRKLIREGKKWQDRVPKYIVSWLHGFIAKKDNETIKQLNNVVLGGTFDHFHKGHQALLEKAFAVGKKVTIGIATEKIYKNKLLSETIEPFAIRKKSVSEFLKKKGWLSRAKIISFSHFTGGADKEKNIEAIIVSKRSYPNALKINQLREKNHLQTLRIVIIPDVLADDEDLISSERIRVGEIDRKGIIFGLKSYTLHPTTYELIMPESLRTTLQKPLGKISKSVGVIHVLPAGRQESPKKPTMIIAVGDIIVNSLLEKGIDPDVKIIDFRSRRKRTDLFAKHQLVKKGPSLNKPGTINLKTAEVLRQMIRSRSVLNKDGPYNSWLVVDGEEDLLALPAILFAPLGSLVLYGHWQHGVIGVVITEKIKEKVRNIIKKFL